MKGPSFSSEHHRRNRAAKGAQGPVAVPKHLVLHQKEDALRLEPKAGARERGRGLGRGSGAQQEGSARRGHSQHCMHVLTYVLFSA